MYDSSILLLLSMNKLKLIFPKCLFLILYPLFVNMFIMLQSTLILYVGQMLTDLKREKLFYLLS